MKRVLFALVQVACAWNSVLAEDPVHFADATLKAAVEEELYVLDPTPTDMLGLTSLYVTTLGITSLTGIEYATNLQTFWCPHTEVSDLSPLSGLTNLEHLTINNSPLGNLSVLSGLHNLRWLDVHDSELTDISALSALDQLEILILRLNKISDISALSNLTGLCDLDLYSNGIHDISPLGGLTSLSHLDLRDNPLNGEACTVYIPLILANNPGVSFDYAPCTPGRLLISSTAGGSVIDPGEGEFAYESGKTVRLEAKADPGFVFANWSGSCFSMGNPQSITISGDQYVRASFLSVLDTIHVDDDGPNDSGPGDSAVSDTEENGTAEHPFDRIQEAIEVARSGVTIVVHAGTYHEMIDLLGKSLTLTGFDPADPNGGGAWPVLDGGGAGPIVSFTHGEDPNCVLSGFVMTAGQGRLAGAILCSASSPTIAHCLIAGNQATGTAGGVVYCTDSNAVLPNCTITDNDTGQSGAGLYLLNSHVKVVNSILWDNGPREIVSMGLSGPSVSYSDIEGGWEGPGCIDADPLFVGAGDYHLQSQLGRWDPRAQKWIQDQATSPCIDAGDPSNPMGDEPLPNGGVINMGAFGGTAQASNS
jgi:hypothetical protein